jgi:hypothetical protein
MRGAIAWTLLATLGLAEEATSAIDALLREQLAAMQSLQHGRVVLRVCDSEGRSIAEAESDPNVDRLNALTNIRYEVEFAPHRLRIRRELLDFSHEELGIATPEYVIQVHPDSRTMLTAARANMTSYNHLFDPRLIAVTSAPVDVLEHLSLENMILMTDRRNESIEWEDWNGLPVARLAFDRVRGNRIERWIAPDRGYLVLRGLTTVPAGSGAVRETFVEYDLAEYPPGIWFIKQRRTKTTVAGSVTAEEVVDVEFADFSVAPADERFTLAAIGLLPGDEVNRDGIPLIWTGTTLMNPISQKPRSQFSATSSRNYSRWLLLGNAILLVSAALLMTIWRFRCQSH